MTAVADVRRPSVLVVDDDSVVRESVVQRLRAEGFEVASASDGDAAGEAIRSLRPDVVVLDLQLPGTSGFEVLRLVRASSGPPVILLSGLTEEADRVLGLEMGADDYVTKPFSTRELAIRVRRLHERSVARAEEMAEAVIETPIVDGMLRIDTEARRVTLDDAEVPLRPREFDLLTYFARHPRQVLSKTQLLAAVWEAEEGWVSEATVTEHVRRLRLKLGGDASNGPIDTLWGVGYRFEPGS